MGSLLPLLLLEPQILPDLSVPPNIRRQGQNRGMSTTMILIGGASDWDILWAFAPCTLSVAGVIILAVLYEYHRPRHKDQSDPLPRRRTWL
jgi:hypothetical protein